MPLSICQVASGCPSWGGVELHILNLSEQLRLRGHDVTVACRPDCWVEERAHQMGLPTVAIQVMKQGDWRDFGKLRRFLRDKQTDVMHVHWSTDVIVPGFAALSERIPVRIMSRHMPYPFKTRFGAMLYSRLLYTCLVPVSHSVRETLLRCGVRPDRIEVVHHGTDVEAFARTTIPVQEARRQIGLPENCIAVGIAGRISPEKGHAVLLEAARLIGDRYPIRIVIIGNGPEEAKIKEQAEALGSQVIFTGFRDDIHNALSAMDIVVVPSTWDEPCSAVVQQGMALGKPVIGTQTGGTPEMVLDGETGLLVPPSDASALAEAVSRLAGDAFLRKRMGAAGRERVEDFFSLRVMTDKIEALYLREYEMVHGTEILERAPVS